jgi:hypothetical protein
MKKNSPLGRALTIFSNILVWNSKHGIPNGIGVEGVTSHPTFFLLK